MHGVSDSLLLTAFVGEECNQIGLGFYQVQFHFSGGTKSIHVESRWELRYTGGNIVDRAMPNDERKVYYVHRILEQCVSGFEIDAPTSFTLRFANGYALTVYDDDEQYECFSLHIKGLSYYS